MTWKDLSKGSRLYLCLTYAAGIACTWESFAKSAKVDSAWLLLALASFLIAGVNLRLPQNPSIVISMGDVFTMLVLLHFGTGPALVTYWANVTATALSGYVQNHGWHFFKKIAYHRLCFNLACCAISVWSMTETYSWVGEHPVSAPIDFVLKIGAITLVWFLVNTGTLSIALALTLHRPIFSVWRQGLGLYLLNFIGSGAAAGLISIYYQRASTSIFILSLPVAIVVYHLYLFYIEKFEQGRSHIDQLNKVYLQTIEAMAMAVDAKDRYTHGHIRRVQVFATELARCCGITDEKELLALKAGALLHDIGKIAIPEYILNKPTVLTASEFEKMKIHPVVGANMLRNIEFPYPVVPAVRSHHERWDGKGYPDGLSGDEIPLGARILSLVDCYDALTTDRPYRSPMQRPQITDFFKKESGRSYDPAIVETFLSNLIAIEEAGRRCSVPAQDIWGIRETESKETPLRGLERVQPTITYGKALQADEQAQRALYSVFEFAHADLPYVDQSDVLTYMGRKLQQVISFDAAAFFLANAEVGEIKAQHVLGPAADVLEGITLRPEQKLTGWVAVNNQALCNLPPFPDFLAYPQIGTKYLMSAIAPINRGGTVIGAISLYRTTATKFDEKEFRHLELIASQTAVALSKVRGVQDEPAILFDHSTKLPNAFQLHLMFDSIATDAMRYEYPLALLAIHLDDLGQLKRRWGSLSVQDAVRTIAEYLRTELREKDLLVRYEGDEFVVLSPGTSRNQAEALKSRLQDVLDRFQFKVRSGSAIPLPVSIGISLFPEDATSLNGIISAAELTMNEDIELRAAVRRKVRRISHD